MRIDANKVRARVVIVCCLVVLCVMIFVFTRLTIPSAMSLYPGVRRYISAIAYAKALFITELAPISIGWLFIFAKPLRRAFKDLDGDTICR